jgi:hypothetical protein
VLFCNIDVEECRRSKVEEEADSSSCLPSLRCGHAILASLLLWVAEAPDAFLIHEVPAFGARGKKIRDERHGPTSWLSITINEGKFRQVRKMTAYVGFPTLRLVRVRVGTIHLNDLQAGEVIEMNDFQIENK